MLVFFATFALCCVPGVLIRLTGNLVPYRTTQPPSWVYGAGCSDFCGCSRSKVVVVTVVMVVLYTIVVLDPKWL